MHAKKINISIHLQIQNNSNHNHSIMIDITIHFLIAALSFFVIINMLISFLKKSLLTF